VSRLPLWRLPGPDPGPGPWRGGSLGPGLPQAECVLAPNPSPMTLDGTNTWVLSARGAERAIVVDPGPDVSAHLAAIDAAVRARGCRVGQVLLTHGHVDHSEGAAGFAAAHGVGVRALDPAHRLGEEGLAAGEVIEDAGLRLDVVATPGHTADSLSFVVREGGAVLTGDTVLGRGTAVIHHPDGELAAYLASLRRLEQLVAALECRALLPGHGPALDRPLDVVRGYLEHRAQRLAEVRAALDAGARTAGEVVERVYADVDRALWPAAERSVLAQLAYLRAGAAG